MHSLLLNHARRNELVSKRIKNIFIGESWLFCYREEKED